MGNGMNKVLPGLYLGSFRDGKDREQLEANKITHIVSIHDNAKAVVKGKQYLCIRVPDSPDENLSKYFSQCNDFIHNARMNGGNVLVHCLAGVSRSAAVTAAYLMSVTNLSSKDALKVVKGARSIANPNYGFVNQLKEFEFHNLIRERKRIRDVYREDDEKKEDDEKECRKMVKQYQTTATRPSALPQASAGISPLSSPRRRPSPSSPRKSISSSSASSPGSSQNSSPYGSPRKQKYNLSIPTSPRKS